MLGVDAARVVVGQHVRHEPLELLLELLGVAAQQRTGQPVNAAAAARLLTQHLDELDRAARAATLARLQEQDPEETNPPKD